MAQFPPAFDFMMSHEDAARSGKVTHDEDGRTRFGIAEKFHPELPELFWTCDNDKALAWAGTIYRTAYWASLQLGYVVDQAVASKLFDMCVPMGRKEAALLVQRAANGLLMGSSKAPAIDGVIGPQTIAAINACPPQSLVEALCNLSRIFFSDVAAKKPEKQKDLVGWLRRAASVPPVAAAAGAGQ
ncbi:MAG TPA: putative peptidoglycan-binding domain-containing protein [Candidatus Angelobacter sp.]|nr:putative peptidoglycan-binding domain-containing protein [Candidatus Angelobacter sp.]